MPPWKRIQMPPGAWPLRPVSTGMPSTSPRPLSGNEWTVVPAGSFLAVISVAKIGGLPIFGSSDSPPMWSLWLWLSSSASTRPTSSTFGHSPGCGP